MDQRQIDDILKKLRVEPNVQNISVNESGSLPYDISMPTLPEN